MIFIIATTISKATRHQLKRHWRLNNQQLFASSSPIDPIIKHNTGDILLSGLNEQQDVSVKVICCKEIIQESMMKNHM